MNNSAGARFDELVEIMRRLRSPHGCPWDREQTVRTLRPFVLEETYELLDALDREDYDSLEGELGDFLFEAVFLAQICEEDGRFSIADSVQSIIAKLVRRHPHVDFAGIQRGASREGALEAFDGGAALPATTGEVKERWEDIKARERDASGQREHTILSGIPRSMPSLLRAYELSTRAATVGLTKSLALELGKEGIRLNSILPGWTETERVTELMSARASANGSTVEEETHKQSEQSPLGRLGRPDEFANAAAFLVSPAASYITGVMLNVDGGMYKGTL